MRGRTDLAVEMKEDIQREEPITGVHVMTKNNGDTDSLRRQCENQTGDAEHFPHKSPYIPEKL